MVGQHPQLAGFPELKLFLHRNLGELDASLPAHIRSRGIAHRSPGLVRAIAQFIFGDQSAAAVGAARQWLRARAAWTGAEVLDALLAAVHPRLGVEKSPENSMTSAALGRLGDAYPRARYLHLVRHPATSALSMAHYWTSHVPDDPLPDLPATCLAAWLDTHRRILRFTAALRGKRYLRLRAEDVLNDPAAHLASIARWLGRRDDPQAITAMRHPELSPFAGFGPADLGVTGGNDPAFLADPIPRRVALPALLERSPGWNADTRLWRSVVELASKFGYAQTDRCASPRIAETSVPTQ
jgi:Sulfotransferase family